MNKDVATQAEDLGIGKPMQIRAVPEKVRRYWNDLAYASRQTLGEYFTSYSLKMMENGGPHSVVDTAVAAPSVPALPRLDLNEMSNVIQAITAAAAAGVPVQKRVVRGVFTLLDGQLRAANGLPALPPPKPRVRRADAIGQPEPAFGLPGVSPRIEASP